MLFPIWRPCLPKGWGRRGRRDDRKLIEQENIDQVNLSLLRDSYTKVIQAIEPISKSVSFTHNNVISLVKETYDYSLKLKLNSADDNFIKWLITQYYNTN